MHDPTTPAPPGLDDLVARWRAAARAGGWRAMADWSDPLASRLAAVALAGGDTASAAIRLGAARAHAGVGVDEGLDDLDRLWWLLGESAAPAAAVRAFATGWADGMASPSTRPAVDPVSGLPTAEVLRVRVADLTRTGGGGSRAIVSVDAVDTGLPRFVRHLEVAAVGALLSECFAAAESPVRLPGDRVAAIVPRDGALDEGVVRLRRAVARRGAAGQPAAAAAAVRVSAVPGDADALAELIRGNA